MKKGHGACDELLLQPRGAAYNAAAFFLLFRFFVKSAEDIAVRVVCRKGRNEGGFRTSFFSPFFCSLYVPR